MSTAFGNERLTRAGTLCGCDGSANAGQPSEVLDDSTVRARRRVLQAIPRPLHPISTLRDRTPAQTDSMRLSKRKFVLLFLAFGYAVHFATKFLLNQPPETLGASPNQEAWQQHVSTILAPLKAVLFGPINWLQQDPDPPPPFRLILCAAYWSLLALGIHRLLMGRTA